MICVKFSFLEKQLTIFQFQLIELIVVVIT